MSQATDPSVTAPPAARVRGWMLAGLLVVLVALVYLPTLSHGYVWDDDHYVTDNSTLRDLHGLWRIWSEPGAVPQYYPLVHTTFWVQVQLTGLDASWFHLVNLLLHAVVAVLVWQTLRRLAVPGAWLAAALFAVHPVNVETVAWVTERKNLLSAVFYFLALLAWLRAARWPELVWQWDRRTTGWYALATLWFAAALLSKTVTCTLPAVLAVLVWWRTGSWGRREWRLAAPLLPWLLLGAAMGWITASMERKHVGAEGPEWAFSMLDRLLIAGRALWFYLGKLALPQDLCFIYPRWQIDAHVWWQYLLPLAFLVLLAALWGWRRVLGRGPVTALALYAGTLFPALGFINVYPMRYSFVADHFAYLAMVPLLALLAAGVVRLAASFSAPHERPLAWALPGVLLLTFGLLASWRTHAFRDEETLWRDTLRHNPAAWIAENNLGELCRQRGDYPAAIAHLNAALALNPLHARAHNNLALCYAAMGEDEQAVAHWRRSLEIQPEVQVILNLGLFYADHHQAELARTCFERAAAAYAQAGHWADAVRWYLQARAVAPSGFEHEAELDEALRRSGQAAVPGTSAAP